MKNGVFRLEKTITKAELKQELVRILSSDFNVTPDEASDTQLYKPSPQL